MEKEKERGIQIKFYLDLETASNLHGHSVLSLWGKLLQPYWNLAQVSYSGL